jgi:hypothetical protein
MTSYQSHPHLHAGGRRNIPCGQRDAWDLRQTVGKQAPLQRLGDVVLALRAQLLAAELFLGL